MAGPQETAQVEPHGGEGLGETSDGVCRGPVIVGGMIRRPQRERKKARPWGLEQERWSLALHGSGAKKVRQYLHFRLVRGRIIGLLRLRPMIKGAGHRRKKTVREKARRRKVKKTEDKNKYYLRSLLCYSTRFPYLTLGTHGPRSLGYPSQLARAHIPGGLVPRAEPRAWVGAPPAWCTSDTLDFPKIPRLSWDPEQRKSPTGMQPCPKTSCTCQ